MLSDSQKKKSHVATGPFGHENSIDFDGSDVLVFIGAGQKNSSSFFSAQKVAQAFGGNVVLLQIVSPPVDNGNPIDPIAWDIRKQAAFKSLSRLAQKLEKTGSKVEARLLEGQCKEQIALYTKARTADIAAFVRSCDEGRWDVSDTTSGVLNAHSAAILMVPASAEKPPQHRIHRIMVPIDGSARSASALPVAARLARAQNAELLLCYVAPEPSLTQFGMLDRNAKELNEAILKRNTCAGQVYLNRIANGLAHHSLNISTVIVPGGDARRALIQTAEHKNADFLVMASHGQTGYGDVPAGDVASFILDRSKVPVLMVRQDLQNSSRHVTRNPTSVGTRKPSGTKA